MFRRPFKPQAELDQQFCAEAEKTVHAQFLIKQAWNDSVVNAKLAQWIDQKYQNDPYMQDRIKHAFIGNNPMYIDYITHLGDNALDTDS